MSETAPATEPPPATKQKRRNPWIWVSALLALAVVGLLIWALSARSDLDSTQSELDSTQQELAGTKQELDTSKQQLDSTNQKLDSTTKELDTTTQELESSQSEQGKKVGPAVFAAGTLGIVKTLYDDLSSQLGATQEDLAATEKELEEANQKAAAADKDAAAAKEKAAQAGDDTEKAKAESEQAQAEAQAATSKAQVTKDCAKAYVSAFGNLFGGDGVKAEAPGVRDQFAHITAQCKTAFSGG
jgi:septal ring factor EnvC (AmiA/AmiB activator)